MAKGHKTGGRQKGSRNKRTEERDAEIREQCGDLEPLVAMLKYMNELWAAGQKDRACAIARDAAPYRHARLASTEVTADVKASIETKNINKRDLARSVLEVLRSAQTEK